MAKINTNIELAAAALNVAKNYKTLYVLGCFGAPMNEQNKDRYISALSFNRQTVRAVKIKSATASTFGFDCSCFIKSLLWGWSGDKTKVYGGATYTSNGVPDIDADQMIKVCTDVFEDFSNIQIGEVVWIPGHIGIYIGDGLAVECTHRWKDGVQVTAVHNIAQQDEYNGRTWQKHGKLPYVKYTQQEPVKEPEEKQDTGNISLRPLKNGDKGNDVRALQILLSGNGCKGYMNASAYGSFGENTKNAVKMYQSKIGVPQTGEVNLALWRRLLGV